MQTWSPSMASPEVVFNENMETLAFIAVFGKNHATTTGLTWGYYGGRWNNISIAAGTLTLYDDTTNYIVVNRSTGAVSVSNYDFDWEDGTNYARAYTVETLDGQVVTDGIEDYRFGADGITGGSGGGGGTGGSESVKVVTTQTYTVLAGDAYKLLVFTNEDGPLTVTIPTAGVDFPDGWWVDVSNMGDDILTLEMETDSPASFIDGSSNFDFDVSQGCRVVSDGTDYWTQRGIKATPPENPTETFILVCSDELTPLTTGVKYRMRMPMDFTLYGIQGSLTTAQGSGSIFTVDILKNGASILTPLLTIDNTEMSNADAATSLDFLDNLVIYDDEIAVQITQIGTPGATGLKIYLIGART